MSNRQFELFDQEHSARIIPFPSDRLIGKARHVVEIITSKKSISAANSYWQKSVLKNFTARLEGLGLDPIQIDHEIQSFHDVVCWELSRCGWFKAKWHRNGPNDAA